MNLKNILSGLTATKNSGVGLKKGVKIRQDEVRLIQGKRNYKENTLGSGTL